MEARMLPAAVWFITSLSLIVAFVAAAATELEGQRSGRADQGFLFAAPPSPAGTSSATRSCKRMPAFITALQDTAASAVIDREVSAVRLTPVVFLRSRANTIDSIRAGDDPTLWREAKLPFAACLSQCVRLPQYARTQRIILSGADGKSRCAYLPSADIPYHEAASVSCHDGTYWMDVITRPVSGDWLVCATVLNTTGRSTQHRMSVSYEYTNVQIGASN